MKKEQPKSLDPRTIGHPAKTVEQLLTAEFANIETSIKQNGPDLYQEGKLFAFQRISDHIEYVLKRERVSGEPPKADAKLTDICKNCGGEWGDHKIIDEFCPTSKDGIFNSSKFEKISGEAKTPELSEAKRKDLNELLKQHRLGIRDTPDILHKRDESDRDWKEDFSHENGNYMNTCMYCKLMFYGYKRRVVCKICDNKLSDFIP